MIALGIDLGTRRIGLAIIRAGIALPLETLTKERKNSDRIRRLVRLAKTEKVECFVVGLPLHMNGSEGDSATSARAFAARLAERSGLPVELVDERLTSVEAEEVLREMGSSRERTKELVDQMAAVLILQSWMAKRSRAQ